MGRGRAKAKQTKVARELKYFSPDTDLSKLEQELHASTEQRSPSRREGDALDDDEPVGADLSSDLRADVGGDGADAHVDYDDYGRWAAGRR